MKDKIIGLAPSQTHLITSCKQILNDLIEVYQSTFGDDFILCEKISASMLSEAKDLVILGPGSYWYFEMKPYEELIARREININIHMYGNPWWYLDPLIVLNKRKSLFKLRVFCSSKDCVHLANKLFQKPDIKHLPFPFLDQKITFEKKQKRNFLYAGRITYQKNIIQLMDVFKQYCDLYGKDDSLIIIGPMDHNFWPNNPSGHYLFYNASVFYKKLQEFKELGYPIEYRGPQSKQEVRKALASAKAHINLSTFEGEDFSRITLEALNCFCPVISLKWNVLKDYADLEGVHLIDLEKSGSCLEFNENEFINCMQSIEQQSSSDLTRFSLKSISEKLTHVYESECLGISKLSNLANFYFQMNKKNGSRDIEFFNLYSELYSEIIEEAK